MQTQFTLRAIFPLLLFLMTILNSCSFNSSVSNRKSDEADGEKVTDQFFKLIKDKKYDETYKLFSNKFWTITTKDKMAAIFQMTQNKLGDLQSIKIYKWETKVVNGTNPSAAYAFAYKNKYSKYDAIETLRLAREGNGSIKIFSYSINSKGFFKL